jgi:hypothetical protein
MFSRATKINVVVLAKLWYVGNIFPFSSVFIKLVNTSIYRFLWKTTEWISRRVLSRMKGGSLGIFALDTRLRALKVQYVNFLMHNTLQTLS